MLHRLPANTNSSITNKSNDNSEGIIPTIHFNSWMIALAEKSYWEQWSPENAFTNLINCEEIFAKKLNRSRAAEVLWTINNAEYMLSITAHPRLRKIKIQYNGDNFLELAVKNNNIIIEKKLAFELRAIWTDEVIRQLIELFNQVIRAESITYIDKPINDNLVVYNAQDFAKLIQQYQFAHITARINDVIIKNSKRDKDGFTFYLYWPVHDGKLQLLKIYFSRMDLFQNTTDRAYSWVLTEEGMLKAFPEFTKYNIPSGQFYFSLSVKELRQTGEHITSKEVLHTWFTSDGTLGELHQVHKGGEYLSGNDVLNIYNYFDELFRVKKTFLCDASYIEDDEEDSVPLRLISALATGKTWYQSKLTNLRLFDCKNFQTAANGKINQNSTERNLLLTELQNLTLSNWLQMLNAEEKRSLLELHKIFYMPKTTSIMVHLFPIFCVQGISDPNLTVGTLAQKIFSDAKSKKTLTPELYNFSTLLTGLDITDTDELVIDSNAKDYWVKSRVDALLNGSKFWIRERLQV